MAEQIIAIDELRAQLSGELITPDEPAYDEARRVFFKGVDRRPLEHGCGQLRVLVGELGGATASAGVAASQLWDMDQPIGDPMDR